MVADTDAKLLDAPAPIMRHANIAQTCRRNTLLLVNALPCALISLMLSDRLNKDQRKGAGWRSGSRRLDYVFDCEGILAKPERELHWPSS
jgi:hypothetical protein